MSAYMQEVLRDTPYRYWKLDEPVGSIRPLDASGNGRHASTTQVNPLTFGVGSAIDGTMVTMDGVNDWADNPEGAGTVINNFTVEVWVKPSATLTIQSESTSGTVGITGTTRFFLYPDHGGDTDGGMGLTVGTNGIQSYEHGTGYLPCLLSWAGTVSSTQMTHVVLQVVAKQHRLYVNNVLVRTGLTSARTNVWMPRAIGSGWGYYAGQLDELAFYNSILSTARIAAHYEAGLRRGLSF